MLAEIAELAAAEMRDETRAVMRRLIENADGHGGAMAR